MQTKVETVDSNGNVTGTIGEYFYDGDGRRVKKVAYTNNQVTETTVFVYDASSRLVAEYSTILNPTPQVAYLTNDHLGSPRINTNENGAVISRHDYRPYGEEITERTHSQYVGDTIRKQFTGYERDNETDLDFAQARYYSNVSGRFSSPDEIFNDSKLEVAQRWNLYTYTRNNPINLNDPSGETADVTITIDEKSKTGTIVVKATIGIWTQNNQITADAMNKAKANIEDGIEKAWSGKFEKDGVTYTVVTDVTVETFANVDDAMKSGVQNVIEMDQGVDSRVDPGGYFTGEDRGKWDINKMGTTTPGHEFGHLLGIENKVGNVLMNMDPGRRHPTMTAEDFDWAFGNEVTSQRYESRFDTVIEDRERGYRKVKVDRGRERDSKKGYRFSHPRGLLWYDFK